MTYPLQALRTFVEVGQRKSVKAAAQALHVTPGAVSQQIRVLEDRLGVVLLERERLGMRLTEAGASVFPRLREAFLQIDQAMHDLESTKARRSLTVSTVATFAASWLVPRLGVSSNCTRTSKSAWRPRRNWWTCGATGWTWPCAMGWETIRGWRLSPSWRRF